jgi:hypothetical protein
LIEPSEVRAKLSDLSPLITEERSTGTGHHLSVRHYPSGDAEAVAIKLGPDDSLKRGGGAKRKNDKKSSMDDPTLHKSQHRARRTIRQKSLTIRADRMLSLTFRENVTDIQEAWDVFKYFSKLMRRYKEQINENFQYVAVPEFQKRGAVHFHLAVHGFQEVGIVRRLWRRASGRRGGNIDITSPRKHGKKSWNPKRIAQYLAKYISKNDSVEFNKRRFSSGGNIQVPDPLKGWIPAGLNDGSLVPRTLQSVIYKLTGRTPFDNYRIDGYYNIYYTST